MGGARTYQRRWVGHSDLKLSRELVMPRTLILARDSMRGRTICYHPFVHPSTGISVNKKPSCC